MSTFGERLKVLRGKTRQADLAAALGMAQTTLSNYETGRNEPNIETIRIFVSHFSVNLRWLMFGEGPIRENDTESTCMESSTKKTASVPLAEETIASLKQELGLEREERRELAAETRRLYREKEQLLREKEELLRENGALRENLARLEAERDKLRSIHDHGKGDFPTLFDENHTTSSSRTAIIRK